MFHVPHRKARLSLFAFALPFFLLGCHTPRSATPTLHATVSDLREAGYIQVGDWLVFTTQEVPGAMPAGKIRLGPDGTLALPFHATLPAPGETTAAPAKDIRAAYAPVTAPLPELQVTRTEVQGCLVLGEVNGDGRLTGDGPLTVLGAIAAAGGPNPRANLKNIRLHRSNGQIVKVDADKARQNPKLDPPLNLAGGDLIIVPSKITP